MNKFIYIFVPMCIGILCVFTIATRVYVGFSTHAKDPIAFTDIFGGYAGMDFIIGAIDPAVQIMHGEYFYSRIQTYGPSVSLAVIPMLSMLHEFGFCRSIDTIEGYFPCGLSLYPWLMALSIALQYVIFFFMTKNNRSVQFIILIAYSTFLLGTAGTLGLQRGNLDVILSAFFAFLCFLSVRIGTRLNYLTSVFNGFIAGFISCSKIFLAPLSLFLLFSDTHPVLSIVSAVITYILFIYLPGIFHAPTDILLPIKVALFSDSAVSLSNPGYMTFNHSAASFASYATNCLSTATCDTHPTISYLWWIIAMCILVLPFIASKQFRTWIQAFLHRRAMVHKSMILVLCILSYVAVNILPKAVFDNRLFYGFPLLILLLMRTKKLIVAHTQALLSVCLLLVHGIWMHYTVSGTGFTFTDQRILHGILFAHFYLFISAGIRYAWGPDH